jgi:GntR family transcriptional repressor for pyruvate dehydrogenase complex
VNDEQPHSMPIVLTDAALRPLKTSESVARDIVRDIVDERLGTGASLPPESVMLQHYGVSRESLREGLRLLEVQGLITLRRGPGGGPVVGTVDPANLGRISTLYYHLVGATYGELAEAWAVAEGVMAELAARHPDRALVRAAMEPYIRETPTDSAESVEQFIVSHSEFHVVLGMLARNRVLQISMMAISEITSHHVVFNADPREARVRIETDHRAIAKAVVAGHHAKARQLSMDHLRDITDFYRGALGPQMHDLIEWR